MTAIGYDALVDAIYAADLDEAVRITPDYSGRAMYGAECLGLVTDAAGDVFAIIAELARAGEDTDWARGARTDSMGRRMITYWPGVTVEGAPEEEAS